VSTPFAGRESTEYLSTWVLTFAATAAPAAMASTSQLRRTSTMISATTAPITTAATGRAFRNDCANSMRSPFQTFAPANDRSSMTWPM